MVFNIDINNKDFNPNDICISGISGRFPSADNVYELRDKLYNKIELISDISPRWKYDHPDIPKKAGLMNDIDKFDASFFGIDSAQANLMDPKSRLLMEAAYEAIVDAGVNPVSVRGSNTGVFIGCSSSESEKSLMYEKIHQSGYGLLGCNKAMFANRIAYWFDFHGPSFIVDTACSSSLYALDLAVQSIRTGKCDAALVGGGNVTLHPFVTLQFSRLGILSKDGYCKTFDELGNGYARSETIGMLYLQKAKDCNRIYAKLLYSKTNQDGFKGQGITFPSGPLQAKLLKDCYTESGITPDQLNYLEAHGTGTVVGDPEEVNAIDKAICARRTKPLLIGSVKSRLGHSEPASGITSVIKVVLAMESGKISPNLHFNNPRKDIPALMEGRVKVVAETTDWEGGIAGINSFGFGGGNAHVILQSNPSKKPCEDPAIKDQIPRLVVVSGRTEKSIEVMLHELETIPLDSEYIGLILNVHATQPIPGHIYRGFTVLNSKPQEKLTRDIQRYSGIKRPVWFVFSGLGTQWVGMGRELLKLKTFANSIKKCDSVLKPFGLDIYKIISGSDSKLFDNILNSCVGIAAIQIGLVDILNDVGIIPDGIVGHSIGELACAYADGCLTAEEMILSAYSCGLVTMQTKQTQCAMVDVGLGYVTLAPMCPSDIDVVYHNGKDSSTISGPVESVKKFVVELKTKGIFVSEMTTSNNPYHSRYIQEDGIKLIKYLREIIKSPKLRSSKWISSSVPEQNWNEHDAKYSSAEYFTNNLLRSVLFAEALTHVPNNAITIEIAPHGLLQAILKRTLSPECTNIALTQRDTVNELDILFASFGKMYMAGMQPRVDKLNPPVAFPVKRGTPMISPLVRWDHTSDYKVSYFDLEDGKGSGERNVRINVEIEDHEFYTGHVIDGRNLFPATGYLFLVWETLAAIHANNILDFPVVFEDVKFLSAAHISKEVYLDLVVTITLGTGAFEIAEGTTALVTGHVRHVIEPEKEKLHIATARDFEVIGNSDEPMMETRDIYKELRLRGYKYSGLFKGLEKINVQGTQGYVKWDANWVSFMDCMLQAEILHIDSRSLYVPTGIRKLVIDPLKHLEILQEYENKHVPIKMYKNHEMLESGGVQVLGVKASAIARKRNLAEPVYETCTPYPLNPEETMSYKNTLCSYVHLILENLMTKSVKVNEWVSPIEADITRLIGPEVISIIEKLPLAKCEMNLIGANTTLVEIVADQPINICEKSKLSEEPDAHFILINDGGAVLAIKDLAQDAMSALLPGGFLIVECQHPNYNSLKNLLQEEGFDLISTSVVSKDFDHEESEDDTDDSDEDIDESILLLFRKLVKTGNKNVVVNIGEEKEFVPEFNWLDELQNYIKSADTIDKIYLVSQSAPMSGILGLFNCLLEESYKNVRCVFILDKKAPEFNPEDPFYVNHLSHDLRVNVLLQSGPSDVVWATYRHVPLEPVPIKSLHAFVKQTTRGDLSSFEWLQGPITSLKDIRDPDYQYYHIYYSSLNFRDVMLATGKLAAEIASPSRFSQDSILGFEFSGKDVAGRRIMGLTNCKAMSNLIQAYKNQAWEIPDHWTLEDAATVPVVYYTVYYALIMRGKLCNGESILIHSGTGGVGQAAINVALEMGCTVYVTVGTEEKRKFILETYPSIPESHIGNSRDTSFEQMIMQQTKGIGVDAVLNSLAGDKLFASVRCLKQYGRFLEIGKVDMAADSKLGMYCLSKNISFHGILVDSFFERSGIALEVQLHKLVHEGIRKGTVKPLKSRTVFGPHEIEQAFRYMAAGKHMGKVMIRIREEEKQDGPNSLIKPQMRLIGANPRFYCNPDKTYVLIGGLGGFGLELADWLILRGAKKIVLNSRSGVTNGYQAYRINIWKSYGVEILVSRADVSCEQGCIALLENAAKKLGPVDAIFNLAVVLKDGLFENQTKENFVASYLPKGRITYYMDLTSRRLCPSLRHFVVFSSVSCGRGNAGQTNYGLSNSVMERICEQRRSLGFPALAIQWGAIGDVGIVADFEFQSSADEPIIEGTKLQSIDSCLNTMDIFLNLPSKHVIVSSMVVAEKSKKSGDTGSVIDTVVNIIGIKDIKTVSAASNLAELGMDSMMAVEIKQTLEREFDIYLTPQEIRTLTIEKLHEYSKLTEEKKTGEKPTAMEDDWLLVDVNFLINRLGSFEEMHAPTKNLSSISSKTDPTIFMVPGVEGLGVLMEPLAKQLNYPVCCLQMPFKNIPTPEVSIFANFMLQTLRSVQKTGPYYLIGFSYGTVPLLEMAWELEQQGEMVYLWLLDGSIESIQNAVEAFFNYSNVPAAQFEAKYLSLFLKYAGVKEHEAICRELEQMSDWNIRLTRAAQFFPDILNREQQILLINAIIQRSANVMKYKWCDNKKFLKSKATLIRTHIPMINSPNDYFLQKLFVEPVQIHTIDGKHIGVLVHKRTGDIINEEIEKIN